MAELLEPIKAHQLMLENRERLHLTGVRDVDSFDETRVIVYTELGELTVGGTALHIQNLNTENGDLTLEGHISALYYAEETQSGGLFSRLFK
ncbi:MAG: sporulation protein YabP [Clostridia bacterium]|nr:sporulation protein YabP [Clostridia bacterium]